MKLKYRIAIILALCALSIWALFPRTVIERTQRNGVFVTDTVRRIPVKLGLDLQGGMHLALEIDESKGAVTNKSEALDRALTVIRSRIDQFGVAEPVIQKVGDDRIIVELPGIDDEQRAVDVVQQSAFLEFQITDKSGSLDKALPRIDAAAKTVALMSSTGTAGKASDTTARSPNALQGLFSKDSAPKTGATDSAKRDSADTTKKSDSAAVTPTSGTFSKLIQQGQTPGEYYVALTDVNTVRQYLESPAVQAVLPPGKVLRWANDSTSFGNQFYRGLYVLDARPIITGEYLTDAKATTSPMEGTAVTFTLNNEGGRRFRNETSRHIQDNMAIVLDQRVMGQPPVIQSAIGTNGQITLGQGARLERAQDLALVLRAGALPAPLKVVEVRTIGPSLGKDSIDDSIMAGIIALLLLFLVMVVYYRFSGFLAVAALLLYCLYTLAVLVGFDAVLTLPGLAGFVLSIGMAIDANVLIFERIREELDRGRSVRLAIDEGFRHALPAIIDTNASSALTAAVLYQFGSGPVRGFAVTLMAGMASSMISAVFVVRTFYMIWLTKASDKKSLSI